MLKTKEGVVCSQGCLKYPANTLHQVLPGRYSYCLPGLDAVAKTNCIHECFESVGIAQISSRAEGNILGHKRPRVIIVLLAFAGYSSPFLSHVSLILFRTSSKDA